MENFEKFIEELDPLCFYEKVDMHIHSSFSDGTLHPCEILQQAVAKGMSKIAISDHNTVEAYSIDEIASSPLVVKAVEFDCWHKGVLVHILGYDFDCGDENIKQLCSRTKNGTKLDVVRLFDALKRKPKKVIEAIHMAGGKAILAHPACCWTFNLESFIKSLVELGLDGLEVYYPYNRHRKIIKFHSKRSVFEIAQKLNLLKTGGSDNHSSKV